MASQEAALVLSDEFVPSIRLHATAVFTILNSHIRREDKQSRVIGSLLGYTHDGFIEVTECFPVPHLEKLDDSYYVAINKDYHRTMYNFHQRINKKEVLLGWYSTTLARNPLIIDRSSLIHEFYSHECKAPIHLVVDTNLNTGNNLFNIRGYISQPMILGDLPLANMFRELPVEICMTDAEIICINQMIHGQVNDPPFSSVNILSKITSPMEEITTSTIQLTELLNKISQYLQDTLNGKREADPEIGIMLADILSGLQVVNPEDFNTYFDNKVQDLLMVSYLTSLTKSQLLVAEKLIRIL